MQLIIATVQTSSHEKAPEILTDDNIKLLFDIQKKVSQLFSNPSNHPYNVFMYRTCKKLFNMVGRWTSGKSLRFNGFSDRYLHETPGRGLCHTECSAGCTTSFLPPVFSFSSFDK